MQFYINQILFFVFSFITIYEPTRADAPPATLHVVSVCDTTEFDIGLSTRRDCELIDREINKIAFYTGMKLNKIRIADFNTTPKKVLDKVRTLNIASQDTVLFYFSGHGFHRTKEANTRWPELFFSLTEQGLRLSEIESIIKNKKPRLTILIADSCNNYIEEEFAPLSAIRKSITYLKSPYELRQSALKKLFLEANGVIYAVGAVEGEYSIGTDDGGFFTHTFFEVLNNAGVLGNEVDWDTILMTVHYILYEKYNMITDYAIMKKR